MADDKGTVAELDEMFLLNLSNAVYALISGGQAAGTIVNDDSGNIMVPTGINSDTGTEWAPGDTYHLMFVASSARDVILHEVLVEPYPTCLALQPGKLRIPVWTVVIFHASGVGVLHDLVWVVQNVIVDRVDLMQPLSIWRRGR